MRKDSKESNKWLIDIDYESSDSDIQSEVELENLEKYYVNQKMLKNTPEFNSKILKIALNIGES